MREIQAGTDKRSTYLALRYPKDSGWEGFLLVRRCSPYRWPHRDIQQLRDYGADAVVIEVTEYTRLRVLEEGELD